MSETHIQAEEEIQKLRRSNKLLDFCPTEVVDENSPVAVVVCCVDHRLLSGRLGWMWERLKSPDALQVYTHPGGINWFDPKYQQALVNRSNADAIAFSVEKLRQKYGFTPPVLAKSDTPCLICEDRGHTVCETIESGLRGRAFLERRLREVLSFPVNVIPLLHARRCRESEKDLTYRIPTDMDHLLLAATAAAHANTPAQSHPFMRAVH